MPVFADVALHLPVDRVFTYLVPKALASAVRPGMRVRVPFQSRDVGGTCVGIRTEAPDFAVRSILALVEPAPVFGPPMLRLARWIARRYGAALGQCLDAALPFAVRSGGRRRLVAVARIQVEPPAVEAALSSLETKFPKQARALRILADAGGPLEVRELARRAHVTESPIGALARKNLVAIRREPQQRDPLFGAPAERDVRKVLSPAQAHALAAVLAPIATRSHAAFLLFGVTGSGKTEVYLRALEEVVAAGRQGIVLVPEIALTPQTVARFRARFERVAVLHSHLTDAERHEQWKAIQRGDADVVIGARSAIFAPTPCLGLIVVDEEHENTFKQQNAPRYDAREVARARARFERAVLLLGSATPSLESYQRGRSGRIGLLRLVERVGGGAFPETIVADLNQTVHVAGRPRFLTDRLRALMAEHVARKGQVILFLNRRGYATAARCRECGEALECENCDIVLVYHRRIGRVLCHYCGHERRLPPTCPNCSGPFRLSGFGTERIEDEVRHSLPGVRVARMDSDTMKARGAHEEVLDRFRRGELDVLVGTQMIAKGLDFPDVTLVGIVSADVSLNLPDYRAAERTFSLIAQVAGRSGRSERGGMVLVQTHCPDHFAVRLALRHDYEAFARIELEARRKDGYPPFGHLARVVVQGPDEGSVAQAAVALRHHLSEWIADDTTQVLGPAPAPIALINGQHRQHIVAKAGRRSGIRQFVKVVRGSPRPKGRVRVLLDVDPHAML